MKCEEARAMLHGEWRPLGRALARVHLLRCGACRAEAARAAALAAAIADLPRFAPPPDLLARLLDVSAPRALTSRTKERAKMKRLAYVLTFLLVVGLLAGGFAVRSHSPDGRAILLSAAEAMQTADSVYLLFRGTETSETAPSGMRTMPGAGAMWLGDTAVVLRYLDPDGGLRLYARLDAGRLTWDSYDRESMILYQADLGSAGSRLQEILGPFSDMLRSGQVTDLELRDHPDAQIQTHREVRDGHAVDVVTFSYPMTSRPHVMIERVFEIDAATHRLLGARRYASTQGPAEEMIDSVDRIRYDEPMPPELAALPALPPGTQVVAAEVRVQETDTTLSLVMAVDGKEIQRAEVPKRR
jgi:hypothetical protein